MTTRTQETSSLRLQKTRTILLRNLNYSPEPASPMSVPTVELEGGKVPEVRPVSQRSKETGGRVGPSGSRCFSPISIGDFPIHRKRPQDLCHNSWSVILGNSH